MTKINEKRKVIELRKEGKTYSEIRKMVKVSKSTLSLWLKTYPLSGKQLERVKKIKYRAIEKFRETMKIKRKIATTTQYNTFCHFCSCKRLPLSFILSVKYISDNSCKAVDEYNVPSFRNIYIRNGVNGVFEFLFFG